MDKPFDVKMSVGMPDGSNYEMEFNLLDIKREFSCAICSSIGDNEKISLLSMSDHFARHYMENNRAGDINIAITEDLKKPIPHQPNENLRAIRRDIDDYDRAVDGGAVDDAIMNKSTRDNKIVYYDDYSQYNDGLSEEQMLQMAMEESMREVEVEKVITPQFSAEPPVVTPAVTPYASTVQAPVVAYPPRKKKDI